MTAFWGKFIYFKTTFDTLSYDSQDTSNIAKGILFEADTIQNDSHRHKQFFLLTILIPQQKSSLVYSNGLQD